MTNDSGLLLHQAQLRDYILHAQDLGTGQLLAISAAGDWCVLQAEHGTPTHHQGEVQHAHIATAHPTLGMLAMATMQGAVLLYDIHSGRKLHHFRVGMGMVDGLAFSPNGAYLAAVAGKRLVIWHLDSYVEALQYTNPDGSLLALQWSADNQLYVAGYKSVIKFSPAHTEPSLTLSWPNSLVSLAVNPQQNSIACGTQDNGIHFWELPYYSDTDAEMSGYPGKVKHLAWNADGTLLASNAAHLVVVWPVKDGKAPVGRQPLMLKGHVDKITSLSFYPNQDLLCSGDAAGNIIFWHPGRGNPILAMEILPNKAAISALHPGTDYIAVGTGSGGFYALDYPI